MTTSAPIHDAMTDAGLAVEDRRVPGYRNLPYAESPVGIIIHHDAIAGQMRTWDTSVRISQQGHSRVPGPLYHVAVAPDGTIAAITDGRANHAGRGSFPGLGGNSNTVGIMGHNAGTGSEQWPGAQVRSMVEACAALCIRFGIHPEYVIGHKEWTRRKIDPNGTWAHVGDWSQMGVFRSLVQETVDTMTATSDPMGTPVAIDRIGDGYVIVDAEGVARAYGTAHRGDMAGTPLAKPVVGVAGNPVGEGYWMVASDGGVFAFGVPFLGSAAALPLAAPVVDIEATPSGKGYWLLAADGGLFAYGDAVFLGRPEVAI